MYKDRDCLTDYNDRTISSESVPESFAAHFSEVVRVLDAKIPLNVIHSISYLNERIFSKFFAFPSTSTEVTEIIISLQKKRSPTNNIPPFENIKLFTVISERISANFSIDI